MFRPQLSLQFVILVSATLFATFASAQQKKAVTPFTQQVQHQQDQKPGAPSSIQSVDIRVLAQYEFANAYPKDLNDAREEYLNDGTGTTRGGFYDLSGFGVGLAYRISSGFLGLEFNRVIQTLSATPILVPAPAGTIKESFEIETLYLTHDWVFQNVAQHSFEMGGGIGYATKFKLSEQLSGTGQTVTWKANPLAVQIRFSYSYHFSHNVRFRTNVGYEYITPTEIKAEEDYPNITYYGTPLMNGRSLQNFGGPVNVDFSGVRAAIGVAVAF